jgi:senataxin
MAPAIRLQVEWPACGLVVAIECRLRFAHLAAGDYFDEYTNIRQSLTFHTRPGCLSSEGLNIAQKHFPSLDPASQQLLFRLWELMGSTVSWKIQVVMLATESSVSQLLPYVIGPDRLPSLLEQDWAMYRPLSLDRTPLQLVTCSTPHPMVPFDCTDTFTSLGHAQVELFESARISFVEQELGLELWASVRHEGTLYKIGGAVVLAVRFRVHPLLSSATHNVRFRLPERVRAEMQWVDARTGLETQVKGERCSVPIKLLRCDALFVITSNITTLLEEACNDPEDLTPSNNIMVQFSVKMPPFTLMSQLHTSIALTQPATKRWRQILLNQNHDLEVIDLAKARAPGPQRTEAPHSVSGRWDGYVDGQPGVLLWRKWNTEQRKAIESIRKARGGFTLVTGPAGTGKTLVEQAMCRFFWQVGLHVIVLAPANSNVADFMQKLKKESRDINDGLRVFPSSAEVHLRDAIRREGPAVLDEKPVCEAPAPNSGVFEFEMVRASLNAIGEKYRGRDLGVQEQVWRTARESSLTLFEHLKDDHSRPIGSEIDMWEKLRECMRACEAGEFDWKDPNAVTAYEQCYKACKGHLIARSRLIVTTTGNVGCSDIQENWAQDKHGLYCKGVVIILDEACKDKEIDTLSALMCAGFRHKVTGMVMVGDDRQLEPTNTSAKGNVQFNPFHERSNIPLLSRMKREGFPCVELVEQHRMVSIRSDHSHVLS